MANLLGELRSVVGIRAIKAYNFELFLSFVGNEAVTESLRTSVDIQVELRENREPDIVGADEEVLVLIVGACAGVDKAVICGDHRRLL